MKHLLTICLTLFSSQLLSEEYRPDSTFNFIKGCEIAKTIGADAVCLNHIADIAISYYSAHMVGIQKGYMLGLQVGGRDKETASLLSRAILLNNSALGKIVPFCFFDKAKVELVKHVYLHMKQTTNEQHLPYVAHIMKILNEQNPPPCENYIDYGGS